MSQSPRGHRDRTDKDDSEAQHFSILKWSRQTVRQDLDKAIFTFAPTRGAWIARSGELVCVSRGKDAQGYIRTTERFGDYVLSLDFRVPPGCNSKLYLRIPEVGTSHPGDECVVIQISDDFGRDGSDQPERRSGAIYQVVGPSRILLKSDGAWNTLLVRCDGDHVRVTLNGEVATDIELSRFPELRTRSTSGYIGFACYGANVDGPWFRDIQIAELPRN